MPEPSSAAPRRDRSFAPTVLAGLAGAGLSAVAGSREWASATGDAAGLAVDASVSGAESQPLVPALALVTLAAWGVVLVTRGRVRRAVAVLGLVAAVGALVALVLGFGGATDDARAAVGDLGASGDVATSLSSWYYLAGLGAALTAVAFAVAVARAPRWPAMGSRYDAPSARPGPAADEDMWRALDEGRDPTS